MSKLIDRLEEPALRESLREVLVSNYESHVDDTLERLLDRLADLLAESRGPVRKFTGSHLRVVYLLAESQGSTHTRLSRAWGTKAARSDDRAWPWISDSGLRTRTAELVAWGLVEWGGGWGETAAGGRSRIWQLTGVDPVAAGRPHTPVPGVESGLSLTDVHLLVGEARGDVTIRAQLELAAKVAGLRA